MEHTVLGEKKSDFVDPAARGSEPSAGSLLTTSEDGELALWPPSEEDMKGLPALKECHLAKPSCLQVSTCRKRALSGNAEGHLWLWDLVEQRPLGTMKGQGKFVFDVSANFEVDRAFSCSSDGNLTLWDLQTCAPLQTLCDSSTKPLAVSADFVRRLAVSGGEDGLLKLWELSGENDDGQDVKPLCVMEGHEGSVVGVAADLQNSKVVTCSADSTVRIWNLERQTCLGTLKGHEEATTSIAVDFQKRTVVSGSRDKTLKIWDLNFMRCIGTLSDHTGAVGTVALDCSRRRIASGADDCLVKEWDLATLQSVRTLKGHRGGVTAVRFLAGDSALGADAKRSLYMKRFNSAPT